ncbi:DsbA family protein [Agrilactobacillus yilanensis]|uniref:DsbA family protein n=1 Tax=Agrilactobacillus yilanensis TaxID=2485997 RepID=A0ABW4J7Y1_9LACO|nr:DsbA family protein [Agrilactobacillus yilanensis]
MLEVFLFVNPIGYRCLSIESTLRKVVAELNTDVTFTLVPYVSVPVVNTYMTFNHLDKLNLTLRNRLTQDAYAAALDFKAVSFQGRKKSRHFLMNLQHLINVDRCPYDNETVKQALEAANADLDWFLEERNNPDLKELCAADEALINEYHITDTPTMVAFNHASDVNQDGIVIENCMSYVSLRQVLERLINDECFNTNQPCAANTPHLNTL